MSEVNGALRTGTVAKTALERLYALARADDDFHSFPRVRLNKGTERRKARTG
jgi:hypothetical protein